MSRVIRIVHLFAILLWPVTGVAKEKPFWVVIGPDALLEEVRPLSEHRASQGMDVTLTSGAVKEVLASLPRKPDYLLLLGDDVLEGSGEDEPLLAGERRQLYRWKATQPETFVSDAAFGDLDADGIPEVPVGRLPARGPKAVSAFVEKLMAFEEVSPRLEDLSLPVWAGDPNYGGVFQAAMASHLLRQTLRRAPDWLETWLIMGNPQDALSGWPPDQASLFEQRIARGGVLVGMMGHGSPTDFFSMRHDRQWVTYDVDVLNLRTPSPVGVPPAVIYACDCGNFAHGRSSLAESMLEAPGGPVAVIAATTQSHPLPNYYSSVALLEMLHEEDLRLGDLWVRAQREGYSKKMFMVESFLAGVEGKLEEKLDTPRIRSDHLLLYALLGDPATRLRLPKKLNVDVAVGSEDAARRWKVTPPDGATRLIVSHRVPQETGTLVDAENADAARRRFAEASARLAFKPLREYGSDEPWEGIAKERGTLRWVAFSPDWIYAAGLHFPGKQEE